MIATLTPSETAVMHLHDCGLTMAEIAHETGMSKGRVRSIVDTFRVNVVAEDQRTRMAAELGSKALLAAVLQAQGAA